MVRHYKRKPGRVNPDRRMARAAELRAQGLSLRQIAERLSCDASTVLRDLRRWECEHPNVTPLVLQTTVESSPPRGEFATPVCNADDPNIISLSDRRKRA